MNHWARISRLAPLGLFMAAPLFAQTWVQSSAPTNNWWSIACSANGSNLVASTVSAYRKAMYSSSDSGANWISNNAPALNWYSIASSAEGTKLLAAAYGNGLYTSDDSGVTWVSNAVPVLLWFSVACSGDGTRLLALAGSGQSRGPIFTSFNFGTTWVSNNVAPDYFQCAASSADGSKLFATSSSGYYASMNAGSTWTSNGLAAVTWGPLACSVDGTKLVAAVIVGGAHRVFTSSDSGVSWVTNNAPISRAMSAASSADGSVLAVADNNFVWVSTDAGATWMSNNLTGFWHGVAISADAGKIAAIDATPGAVWLAQLPSNPKLDFNMAGNNLRLSWIVPSRDFGLQQSSDVSPAAWSTVANPPILNPAALQYEVLVPAAEGRDFYRLSSQ